MQYKCINDKSIYIQYKYKKKKYNKNPLYLHCLHFQSSTSAIRRLHAAERVNILYTVSDSLPYERLQNPVTQFQSHPITFLPYGAGWILREARYGDSPPPLRTHPLAIRRATWWGKCGLADGRGLFQDEKTRTFRCRVVLSLHWDAIRRSRTRGIRYSVLEFQHLIVRCTVNLHIYTL